MFGKGVYFAENSSKSNTYVSCPCGGFGPTAAVLNEKEKKYYQTKNLTCCTCGKTDTTFVMLLCRVMLGNPLIVHKYDEKDWKGKEQSFLPNLSTIGLKQHKQNDSVYHSVIAEKKKSQTDTETPLNFREFIVYSGNHVYPEFVVHYKRVGSEKNDGKSVQEEDPQEADNPFQ